MRTIAAVTLLALVSCDEVPFYPLDGGARDGNPGASRWTVVRQPDAAAANLLGLWGDSPDHLFLVGSGGTLLRAQPGQAGLDFTPMQAPTMADLWAVSGTSATDVYAVGNGGTILHYDGAAWVKEPLKRIGAGTPDFTGDLFGVFAYKDGAIAVGKDGYWARRVMGSWVLAESARPNGNEHPLAVESLYGVWGTGPGTVYAVGSLGYIFQWNGMSWSVVPPPANFTNKLAGVFGGGGSVFAVGLSGSLLKLQGGQFIDYGAMVSVRCGGSSGALAKVFWRSGAVVAKPVGAVVLAGWEGAIARVGTDRCGDAGMALQAAAETGATQQRLDAAWGQGDGTLYIAGAGGIVLRGQ